jgi:hypothetical protein
MQVQVLYSGDPTAFAWVLPVSGLPEIFTSTDQVFTTLDGFTRPTFAIDRVAEGPCDWDWPQSAYSGGEYPTASSSDVADSGVLGGVTVVATASVGPCETTTLGATDATARTAWRTETGYAIPSGVEPLLAPYVADGQYFVAFKLQSDKTTGDLVPIGLRFPGDTASIPIQLTSIAATADMRLRVYVAGAERAVPSSYLHLVPNDAALDWWRFGDNYDDVITLAADEAGGHGFATDFSGSTSVLDGALYQDDHYDLDSLRAITDPGDWVSAVMRQFTPSNQLLNLLLAAIPVPDGVDVDGTTWINDVDYWTSAYGVTVTGFDPVAATDSLDAGIVTPLRDTQEDLDRLGHLSRLTSSVSPVEMTVDPSFVLNGDMAQDVSEDRRITELYHCAQVDPRASMSWRTVTYANGVHVDLPSPVDLQALGMTELEYLASLGFVNAVIIYQTSDSGEPTVLYDGTADVQAAADAASYKSKDPGADGYGADSFEDGIGCGCDTGSGGANAAVAGIGMLLAVISRRRNR